MRGQQRCAGNGAIQNRFWCGNRIDQPECHGLVGVDLIAGLNGSDTYFVNNPGDVVSELAGFGIGTLWSTFATTTLAANVEGTWTRSLISHQGTE